MKKRRIVEIESIGTEDLIEAIAERVIEQMGELSGLALTASCTPCEERWLTTSEVLEELKISRPTLDNMRRNNDIKFIRIGRGYRYQLTSLSNEAR